MDSFATKLIRWQKRHGRHHLPWQNTHDPYAIWLSEIMLQQTQVSIVIPYYLRFLRCFPNIKSLALASLDDVLAQWSGLGYYSRGRNLHQAANLIIKDYGGVFPRNVEIIRQLPGIGRSTAAAIAVFAYGERCAILDGNVKRILARCFGIDGYAGDKKIEALLWLKAEELLPHEHENEIEDRIEVYTQALMDLGATICTRGKPKCRSCPLQRDCIAFQFNQVDKLPLPKPRKPLPQQETVFLMLMKPGQVFLEKRSAKGIWGGLWCLPEMPVSETASDYCMRHFDVQVEPLAAMESFDHTFTHFKLRIHPRPLHAVSCSSNVKQDTDGSIWTTFDEALKLAIPSPVRKLLLDILSFPEYAETQ